MSLQPADSVKNRVSRVGVRSPQWRETGFFQENIWLLYRFRLHRNDLTTEGAENAEGENTEMNNSDATGFDITRRFGKKPGF
ncbi:hypothetical protein [Microcoleus sp. OTE_8_concoct_300]|uniref:hypothetical protein n=1 Tax=Microcoleus sp. OTE_8_concoct_300 TaxID=2964710 RepID=UPI00403F83A0